MNLKLHSVNDILLSSKRSHVECTRSKSVALDTIPTMCLVPPEYRMKIHFDLSSPKYRHQYLRMNNFNLYIKNID